MSSQQKTGLGTYSWLLVLLALLLMNVLFGGRLWGALFPRLGVADLLQGVLGFVLMLLMLCFAHCGLKSKVPKQKRG